jgi:hypothetical protein
VLQIVFNLFLYNQLYCHFMVYFDLNWNFYLVKIKKTQKVNKRKLRCKTSRIVLVVRTYELNEIIVTVFMFQSYFVF